MGFALPSGVINTNSAYFFANATLKLGALVKGLTDQTLVIVDYSKVTPPLTLGAQSFTLDVSSNPQLVVSYPVISSSGKVLSFLVSGGIEGQQYNITILVNEARADLLTVNIPSFGDCGCTSINPVPAIYNQLPLGTQGYVNSGVRFFWGVAPPSNPNVFDQWYNSTDHTLSEWVTSGTSSFWEVISGGGGGGGGGVAPPSLLTNMESLTITAENTVSPVAFTPTGGLFMLIVNGATFTPVDGSFTISGKNIIWTSTIYSIQPGATVIAIYSYAGTAPHLLTNMESLTASAENTLPPVTLTPAGGLFMLVIDGVTFTAVDGSFTLSGKNITWTSSIYSVQPSDTVIAIYSYTG